MAEVRDGYRPALAPTLGIVEPLKAFQARLVTLPFATVMMDYK
jgi:hypothetical protein